MVNPRVQQLQVRIKQSIKQLGKPLSEATPEQRAEIESLREQIRIIEETPSTREKLLAEEFRSGRLTPESAAIKGFSTGQIAIARGIVSGTGGGFEIRARELEARRVSPRGQALIESLTAQEKGQAPAGLLTIEGSLRPRGIIPSVIQQQKPLVARPPVTQAEIQRAQISKPPPVSSIFQKTQKTILPAKRIPVKKFGGEIKFVTPPKPLLFEAKEKIPFGFGLARKFQKKSEKASLEAAKKRAKGLSGVEKEFKALLLGGIAGGLGFAGSLLRPDITIANLIGFAKAPRERLLQFGEELKIQPTTTIGQLGGGILAGGVFSKFVVTPAVKPLIQPRATKVSIGVPVTKIRTSEPLGEPIIQVRGQQITPIAFATENVISKLLRLPAKKGTTVVKTTIEEGFVSPEGVAIVKTRLETPVQQRLQRFGKQALRVQPTGKGEALSIQTDILRRFEGKKVLQQQQQQIQKIVERQTIEGEKFQRSLGFRTQPTKPEKISSKFFPFFTRKQLKESFVPSGRPPIEIITSKTKKLFEIERPAKRVITPRKQTFTGGITRVFGTIEARLSREEFEKQFQLKGFARPIRKQPLPLPFGRKGQQALTVIAQPKQPQVSEILRTRPKIVTVLEPKQARRIAAALRPSRAAVQEGVRLQIPRVKAKTPLIVGIAPSLLAKPRVQQQFRALQRQQPALKQIARQELQQVPISKNILREITIPRQIVIPKTQLITETSLQQILTPTTRFAAIPPTAPPFIPPKVPFILPFLKFKETARLFEARGRVRTRFKPSLFGIVKGKRLKTIPKGIQTGFEVRGIPKQLKSVEIGLVSKLFFKRRKKK